MSINIPFLITNIFSIILMIGLPIFLAFFFTRRFKISWWVVLAGVITFIVSQAARIPATTGINLLYSKGILSVPNQAWLPVVNGIISGLLAGVLEETARWGGFKVLRSKAEKFGSALALGAGHGGIESILLCVLGTATTLFTVLFYNPGAEIAKGVSTGEAQYMLTQIQQFWTQPWHFGLLPGVERVIALSTQIFLSTLVWKAVVDRNFIWFALAVLYHTIVDAVAVFLSQIGWSYWAVEGVLAVFLLINVIMLYRFWKDESELEEEMESLTEEDLSAEDEDYDEDDEEDEEGEDEADDDDEDEDEEDGNGDELASGSENGELNEASEDD